MKKKARKYRTTKKKLFARRTFKKKNENQQRGGSSFNTSAAKPAAAMGTTNGTVAGSSNGLLAGMTEPDSTEVMFMGHISSLSDLKDLGKTKSICDKIVFILLCHYDDVGFEKKWETTILENNDLREKFIKGFHTFYEYLGSPRVPVIETGTENNGGDCAIQLKQGYNVQLPRSNIMNWLNQNSNGKSNFFTLLCLYVENIRNRALMLDIIKDISTEFRNGNNRKKKSEQEINSIIKSRLQHYLAETSHLKLEHYHEVLNMVDEGFLALMIIAFIKSESRDINNTRMGNFGFIFDGDTNPGRPKIKIIPWNNLIQQSKLPLKYTDWNTDKKKLILSHGELPDKGELPDRAIDRNKAVGLLGNFFNKHNQMITRLIPIFSPPSTTELMATRTTGSIDNIFGLVDVMKLFTDIDNEYMRTRWVGKKKSWGVWVDDITVERNKDDNLRFDITCNILPQGYLSLMIDLFHDFDSGRGTATDSVVPLLKPMMNTIKSHLSNILDEQKISPPPGVTLKELKDFIAFINNFDVDKINETSHSVCSQIIQSGGSSIIQKHYEESIALDVHYDHRPEHLEEGDGLAAAMGATNGRTVAVSTNMEVEEDTELSGIYMMYHDSNGPVFSYMYTYASLIGDTRVNIPIPIGDRKETAVFDTANLVSQINTLYSDTLNPIENLDGGYGGTADTPRINSYFNECVKIKMQDAEFRINLPIPISINPHLPKDITPYLILDRDTKNWRLFIPINGYDKLNVAAASDVSKGKRRKVHPPPANEVVEELTKNFKKSRVMNVDVEIDDTHLIITFDGTPGMSISFVQTLVGFLEDPRLCLLKTVTDHLFHTSGSVNQIVSRHVLFDILSDTGISLLDKLKQLNDISLFSHVFSIDFGAAGGMATHNYIIDKALNLDALHDQNPELLELFHILNPIEYPVLSGIWARKIEMNYPAPTRTRRDPRNKTLGTRVIGTLFDFLAENQDIINNISLFQESIKQAIIEQAIIEQAKGQPSFESITCKLIGTELKIILHFKDYLLDDLKHLYGKFEDAHMFGHKVRKFISTQFCKDQFMTIGLKISETDYNTLKIFLMGTPVQLSEDQTIRLEGPQNALRHLLLFTRIFCKDKYPKILDPSPEEVDEMEEEAAVGAADADWAEPAKNVLQEVIEAIAQLRERDGSTFQQIKTYLSHNNKTFEDNTLKAALYQGVNNNMLELTGGKYKLSQKMPRGPV